MPLTKKFKHIKLAMEKEYGKKKGKQVAYAYAKKHHLKIHKLKNLNK